jgi:hypothetical protein
MPAVVAKVASIVTAAQPGRIEAEGTGALAPVAE